MPFMNYQDCGCSAEQKLAELADELNCVKGIVTDIRDFLYRQPMPLQLLPSVSSCQTPPPLPPPIPLTSLPPAVSSSACFKSPLPSYQAPPTPQLASVYPTNPSCLSLSSASLAQPGHSFLNAPFPCPSVVDPIPHFPYERIQQPRSLPPTRPFLPLSNLPDTLSASTSAFLSTHPSQIVTNLPSQCSHSPSPSSNYLPGLPAPLSPSSPVPSSTHPPHTLAPLSVHLTAPSSSHPLSTPASTLPLSLAASLNTATSVTPPALPSTPVSALLPPSLPSQLHQHVSPQLSSQHLAGLVNEVRLQSCSRSNFCANMVRRLYTREERMQSNVRGKLGKRQLDPGRLALVQQTALQVYPLGTGEREEVIWRHCIKAIDESCRRLNRSECRL